MMQIDDTFLEELGIKNISAAKRQKILAQITEELEERIGEKITANLTEDQLAEFDAIVEQDDEKIQRWFEVNCPGYQTIVDETIEELKEEIIHDRNVIMNEE